MAKVSFAARVEGSTLCIDVANRSDEPVSVVTLARYLTLELKNPTGYFQTATLDAADQMTFPTASDYKIIAKNSVERDIFRFTLTKARLGPFTLPPVPERTVVRIRYKTEAVLPNLPKALQRGFFKGPADTKELALKMP